MVYDPAWPQGLSLHREPDTTPRYGGARPSEVFQPPTELRPSRTEHVAMGLTRTVYLDDEPVRDQHYAEDFAEQAREQARAARESIMHPPGLRDREPR
jgi:hypothetical protein